MHIKLLTPPLIRFEEHFSRFCYEIIPKHCKSKENEAKCGEDVRCRYDIERALSSSCGCSGCSCSLPVSPSISPHVTPAIIQPLRSNPSPPQYLHSSPIPKDPFTSPINEPKLPESPPRTWFSMQRNNEGFSTYTSERGPFAQPRERLTVPPPPPPTAQTFKGPTGPSLVPYAGGNDLIRSSSFTKHIAPPSIPPTTAQAHIEIMLPTSTNAYVDLKMEPPLQKSTGPSLSSAAPHARIPHSTSGPNLVPNYDPLPNQSFSTKKEETELSFAVRDDNFLTGRTAISKSGYSSTGNKQIQVAGSKIAKEASDYNSIGASVEEDRRPMFLTYYNQECSGVMVAVLEDTSILGATEECLKMGCQAVNAELHQEGSYTIDRLLIWRLACRDSTRFPELIVDVSSPI
ncbi:hypothetical protein RB195_007969 [Necator americanus]|uniref:Uncharacterized protein n=1 Tax=Necator americanus TaxID=51031 RepID=A0ABR1C3H9_NECAM